MKYKKYHSYLQRSLSKTLVYTVPFFLQEKHKNTSFNPFCIFKPLEVSKLDGNYQFKFERRYLKAPTKEMILIALLCKGNQNDYHFRSYKKTVMLFAFLLLLTLPTVPALPGLQSSCIVKSKKNKKQSNYIEKEDSTKEFHYGNSYKLQQFYVVRPLLSVTRLDTLHICDGLKLPIYPDKSNMQTYFLRNRVRKQLLPVIRILLNPKFDEMLCRFNDSMNYL